MFARYSYSSSRTRRMKGSGVFQGLKSLADKLHPQLPLNAKESQRLLTALTSSFRKHLDAAHPQHVPEDKTPKASPGGVSKTITSPIHSSASYADKHLASVLTSPLLVNGTNKLDHASANIEIVQNPHKHPAEILEEYYARGAATIKVAELCLQTVMDDLCNLSIAKKRERIRKHEPGRRTFAWLLQSQQAATDEFADNTRFTGLLAYFLVHEGQERNLLDFVKQNIHTSTPLKPTTSSSVPRIRQMLHFYRWRGRMLRSIGMAKLGHFDNNGKMLSLDHLHETMDLYFEVCDIKRSAPRDHHLEWLPLSPLMSLVGEELRGPLFSPVLGVDPHRFDKFSAYMEMTSNSFFILVNQAGLALVHPTNPSAQKAYQIALQVFTDRPHPRVEKFAAQMLKNSDVSNERHSWYLFFVKALFLLLQERRHRDASWLQTKIRSAFPKQAPYTEQNLERIAKIVGRPSDREESSTEPDTLNVRVPFPSFT